jgi:hypothetical protein
MRKPVRRLPTHGESARACRGRALEPVPAGLFRKLASLFGGRASVTEAAIAEHAARRL